MAQVTNTARGFKLADNVKLKGKNFSCEFSYNMTGTVGCPPKAEYFEKLRAYFAQEAAGTWNKASTKGQKKMQAKFDAADKEFGKFVKDVAKYNITNAEKTIKEQEAKYSTKLNKELTDIIEKDIGPNFMTSAHAAAEKRIMKEGMKIKKSKPQMAFEVGKIVVKIGAVVAAGFATAIAGAATGGVAFLIAGVAVSVWVPFAVGVASKLGGIAKSINKLHLASKKDAVQLEKKLAEIDEKFKEAVIYANQLESKGDAIGMQYDNLNKRLKEAELRIIGAVNPKSKVFKKAKSIKDKMASIERTHDWKAMRAYAPQLRKSFSEFRKVKNDGTFGKKIEKAENGVALVSEVAANLAALANIIK